MTNRTATTYEDDFLFAETEFVVIKDKSRYETRRRKAQEKQRKMWRKKDR